MQSDEKSRASEINQFKDYRFTWKFDTKTEEIKKELLIANIHKIKISVIYQVMLDYWNSWIDRLV